MDLALHASDLLLSSTQFQDRAPQIQDPQPEPSSPQLSVEENFPTPVPLMHFPHCRLDITTVSSPSGSGKFEQVALPGALVRTLLSRFDGDLRRRQQRQQHSPPSPPSPPQQQSQQQQQLLLLQQPAAHSPTHRPGPSGKEGKKKGNKKQRVTTTTTTAAAAAATPTTRHPHPHPRCSQPRHNSHKTRRRPTTIIRIQPHFDDADDWVFSRCLLADFTGFREDEAEVLSAQGRLCCWASVVLQRQQHPPPPPPQGQGRQGQQHKGCGEAEEEEEEEGLHRDRDTTTTTGIISATCGGGQAGVLEVEGGGICNGDDACAGQCGSALEDVEEGEEEEEEEEEEAMWELGFIVHRVGVRDPGSGWCECF
ncbi:hypothetical protein VTG60DRAFT_4414 [Thermothelomyces hinnuleus]